MVRQVFLVGFSVFLGVLTAGCDLSWLAFSDEGFVKSKTRAYGEAIGVCEWDRVPDFHDGKFTWEQGGRVIRGEAGTQAWIKSLQEIHNMDGMFIEVHKAQKLRPDQIALNVTFQAHCIRNSMAMTFSNFVWQANVLWVKRGQGEWKIGYIKELSQRKTGRMS